MYTVQLFLNIIIFLKIIIFGKSFENNFNSSNDKLLIVFKVPTFVCLSNYTVENYK